MADDKKADQNVDKPEGKDRRPAKPAAAEQRQMGEPRTPVANAGVLRLTQIYPQPATLLRPSPSIESLTDDCIYALDTSFLLSPFDGGSETLAELDRILQNLVKKGRIRVPAQALREYVNRRSKKISDIHNTLKQKLDKVQPQSKIDIRLIQSMERYEKLDKQKEALNKATDTYRKELQELIAEIEKWNWSDPVTELYNKVLTPDIIVKSNESVEAIQADFKRRLDHDIPPVGSDADKPEGIGDTIIWHTMLTVARDTKKNVVFVSNETKNDWWVRSGHQTIAVRHELLYEFHNASGQDFGMCNFVDFLKINGAKKEAVKEAAAASHQAYLNAMLASIDSYGASRRPEAVLIHSADATRMALLGSTEPLNLGRLREQLAAIADLADDVSLRLPSEFEAELKRVEEDLPNWKQVYRVTGNDVNYLDQLQAIMYKLETAGQLLESGENSDKLLVAFRAYCRQFVQAYDEAAADLKRQSPGR